MQKFQTTLFPLLSKRHFSTAKPYKFESIGTLKDKILLVSGASRGIGLAIAKRAAKDGAHIILLAKKFDEGTRLPGDVFSAADEIRSIGGKALPIECDIRDDAKLREAIDQGVLTFGGIDIVINNASAMNLNATSEMTADQYDLLQDVNSRGTFLLSKYAAAFLAGSKNPHILNISPPINLNPKWFGRHTAFTISKYGMSMCVLGMSEEFKELGIAVNALWPKTLVTTAATLDLLGKNQSIGRSRTEEVMADAAYVILTNRSKALTGQFFIDEEVLKNVGVNDLAKYKVNPQTKDKDLILNLFLEEDSK